jgi:hypothetical protein
MILVVKIGLAREDRINRMLIAWRYKMGFFGIVFNAPAKLVEIARGSNGRTQTKKLLNCAYTEPERMYELLSSNLTGLTESEVENRLKKYGANEVAQEKQQSLLMRLWDNEIGRAHV